MPLNTMAPGSLFIQMYNLHPLCNKDVHLITTNCKEVTSKLQFQYQDAARISVSVSRPALSGNHIAV